MGGIQASVVLACFSSLLCFAEISSSKEYKPPESEIADNQLSFKF